MIIYFNVFLTLILGLIVGLNLKSSFFLRSRATDYPSLPKPFNTNFIAEENAHGHIQNQSQVLNNCFDILEVRFLTKILLDPLNKVDVQTLNSLANLTLLSAENQRQRRHLFLKELNLKLFLLYGLRESIIRVDDINDKRIKNYTLSDRIDFDKVRSNLGLSLGNKVNE